MTIAIVGLACRYPDAANADELWQTVLGRRRGFRSLPAHRLGADYRGTQQDQTYVTHAGLLRGWEFDRHRFGVPGPLFRTVDQTHWLALQTSAEALADAGFPDGAGLDRDKVGVIFGNSLTGEFSRAAQLRLRWPFTRRAAAAALAGAGVPDDQAGHALDLLRDLVRAPFPEPGDESLAGALSNTIAGRVCNQFDFHGTGYTVDGACASSLLAVMAACRALEGGELDFALAGGVDLSLDPFELVGFARMNALAEGRDMRIYDAVPTGFLPGEGCGVVGLMRSADAERAGLRAYAVLTGWGTSSDGAGGLTRPEESGQVRALRRAYSMAGIDPRQVDLVEGHGTGTAVGDRVELATLNRVRMGATRKAALGSVKANIGHTKAAAGVAGLIKAALAVHHRILPPTTGCREPHELLTQAGSTVRVLAEPESWPGRTATAAVSSMGFGGINTHFVLSGAEGARSAAVPEPVRRWSSPLPRDEIVLLTATGRDELAALLTTLADKAGSLSAAELHDVAATHYAAAEANAAVRCALVADSPERLATVAAQALKRVYTWNARLLVDRDAGFVLAERGNYRIGLLFPGQAAPVRARLDGWAQDLNVPDAPVPLRDGETATAVAQPAIVRQSLAALAWLTELGCRPVGAVGHSLGEITALVWAGALTAGEGLRLAAARGRIMADHGRSGTTMASVGLPADQVTALMNGLVSVAGVNAADHTTIAGDVAEVRRVVERVTRTGARATVLPVSHAFHSEAMRPAVMPLTDKLREVSFDVPRRPVFSTVTGGLLDENTDLAALLVDQLTAPVRFADALAGLARRCDLFVETGPGTTLASLVTHTPVVSVDSGGAGRERALTAAVLGAVSACDLAHWFGGRAYRSLPLDTPITLLANPCEVVSDAVPQVSHEPADLTGADPLQLLRRHLSQTLELPLNLIRPDSTLLGDLHLNSLQVLQVTAEVAGLLGRRVPTAPPSMAEATVDDTAQLLADQPEDDGSAGAIAGVRPWVRAFEHQWRPFTARPASAGIRWTALAPAGHWLHQTVDASTSDSGRSGLAVWIDDTTSIALLLTEIATRRPQVLAVLHSGHPAAAAVARSAAVELECVASCLDLLGEGDVDLALAESGLQLRVGTTVEHLITSVRPLGPGTIPLGPDELCLVTGGVTGITARAAQELATRTGCRLVVLGRSPQDAAHVRDGLAALAVPASYLCCDVTDPAQVRTAMAAARALGPVRGLLHGAGVNEPRVLGDVTAASLAATISPKVTGLRTLLAEIGEELTVLVGFGSIIGRRGLAGQSEYCVANELLRAELEDWALRFPQCRTRALEWSVWSGAGMGERMGVVGSLRDQGIAPIEPEAGAAAMLSAIADETAPTTLLMTGRFPAGPTLSAIGPDYEPLRFSADVIARTPGVEAVLEPVISSGTDLYLDDHRLDGVPVLPAVAGLEAMAQAAAAVAGERDGWEFTDIDLAAPVIVDEQETRAVRVAALTTADAVEVILRDEVDGFTADRFRATVRPAPSAPAATAPVAGPRLRSPHPFYGPLLFHSGRMRGLIGYEVLSAFRVEAWIQAGEESWFSEFHSSRLLLGDLGAHDAGIHVLLACLPHRKALPVHAERMTVWRTPRGVLKVSAQERSHSADEYVFDVRITEEGGAAVAAWEGLRLRAVGPREWPQPLPPELIGPLLSRRMIECGHVGKVDLVSDINGVTALGDAQVGLAWDSGETVSEAVGESDRDAYDRLAEAIAEKADEPGPIAAARVRSGRRALRDLGLADHQPLVIEEITNDGLVVLGAATARVTTYAGVFVLAVALRRGR